LVHSSFSSKVYEGKGFKVSLPKFWKFSQIKKEESQKISGCVRFRCVERNARYIKWLSQCFFLNWDEEEKVKYENGSNLRLKFYNSYDKVGL